MAQSQLDISWIYQCDDIVVEPRAHRLERAGVELSVEPKAYAVLVVLLHKAGEVVSKDTLLDAAWGHRHVTPSVLTRVISQLRHTLGDCAEHPRYIATVHSLGYRFIGEVHRTVAPPLADEALADQATESGEEPFLPTPHPLPPPMRAPLEVRWLAAAITLAVIGAVLAAASLWHSPHDHMPALRAPSHPALVMLPMAHYGTPHALHARRWPHGHRIATSWPGEHVEEPVQARASGYLVLRPEQEPAARD